jgi:hypothetical protein
MSEAAKIKVEEIKQKFNENIMPQLQKGIDKVKNIRGKTPE